MMLFFVLLNFFIFYFLTIVQDFYAKILGVFLFVVTSILIKINIDVVNLPDYAMHYGFLEQELPTTFFKLLFSEPYYFQLGNWIQNYYSIPKTLEIFYYINFFLTIPFFIWLAFLEDISVWKKNIFFAFLFFLFAFILLRNTPAYLLISLLFYYQLKNKFIKLSFLAPLAHKSAFPILLFSFFRNKKVDKNFIYFTILIAISLVGIVFIPFFNIYNKFLLYQDIHDTNTFFHSLYFIGFTSLQVYLFYYNKYVVNNYAYALMVIAFLFLQFVSPILGFRFSIYILLYLFLNTQFKLSIRLEYWFNKLSPLAVVLVVYNYYTLLS